MRLAALVVLLLALPVSAAAAPFGELPFRPVSSAATCLRPTGVPGELVRWVRGGVEVLAARPDGLTPVATVALGHVQRMPGGRRHAERRGRARGGDRRWHQRRGARARRRVGRPRDDPGRGSVLPCGRDQRARRRHRDVGPVSGGQAGYASSARGGPRAACSARRDDLLGADRLGAVSAVTPDGETLVLVSGDRVRLLSAPMGAPFPPGRVLLGTGPSTPAVAAADDGRVLIATAGGKGLMVFEREPGGGEFVRRPADPA